MDFSSIIGHKDIIAGLENAITNDRVGHAYIFSGAKGIGKRTVARIFSAIVLCTSRENSKSCGVCLSCRMFEENTNPDFHVIDPAGTSISVDEIRKVQSDVSIRPMYASKKVYLIIDADRMTVQAQNCLLKTLEEPPGYTVIILTTSNYDALMETIRSRAVKLSFIKNTFNEVREFLRRKLGQGFKDNEFIVSYSGGVIGSALELASSEDFITLRQETLDIVLKLIKSKPVDIFTIYDFFESNKNYIDTILDIMLLFYRDLLVVRRTGNENILINSDKKDIILKNASDFSPQKLMANIEVVESTRKGIKQNANYQLAIEVMLMKLQEENS